MTQASDTPDTSTSQSQRKQLETDEGNRKNPMTKEEQLEIAEGKQVETPLTEVEWLETVEENRQKLKENGWKPLKKTGKTPKTEGEQLQTDEEKQAETPLTEGEQLETNEENRQKPN